MNDPQKTASTMMAAALVLAMAAALAGPAAARPIEGTTTAATASQTVVPYLSHGEGVDASLYAGATTLDDQTVVPYLSHGVGVDAAAFGGTADTEVAATAGDGGFAWDGLGMGAAAALGALLLAAMSLLTLRHRSRPALS